MVTSGILVDDIPIMVAMPEQECRGSLIGTRIWIQMVSSECMVLQNRVDVEFPGVGFNGSITGVGVRFPRVIVLVIFLAMWIVPVNGELT